MRNSDEDNLVNQVSLQQDKNKPNQTKKKKKKKKKEKKERKKKKKDGLNPTGSRKKQN